MPDQKPTLEYGKPRPKRRRPEPSITAAKIGVIAFTPSAMLVGHIALRNRDYLMLWGAGTIFALAMTAAALWLVMEFRN